MAGIALRCPVSSHDLDNAPLGVIVSTLSVPLLERFQGVAPHSRANRPGHEKPVNI